MAWTAPRTWVAGEIVTASLMNTHIRDNERYLKGLDGVPTIESGLVIDNTGGDEYLKLPLLSTAECNSVLDAEGEVAFDEQTHTPKYYNGSAIKDMGDHGNLGGLTDDDHTQYTKKATLTTQGDIYYASGASTPARLGIGTAGQFLKVNSGATAPEWSTSGALTVSETEVYNANAPTDWTDLDLSGTIGANSSLVFLKVSGADTVTYAAFRKNGDTDEFYIANDAYVRGCSFIKCAAGYHFTVLVATDSSGIIEWKASVAGATTIDIIAYIT